MGGVFGGGTVSTSDKRINSMRIQQSAYGLCQPLVYGKNRVAARDVWKPTSWNYSTRITQATADS